MIVNDFDFLIHKKYFNKIIDILRKKKIKYSYMNHNHTLQVFKNNLLIELDNISQKNKNKIYKRLRDFNSYNLTLKIIGLIDLIKIYKNASRSAKDNTLRYHIKYITLMKLY